MLDFFKLAESCIDMKASRHIPLAMKVFFSSSNNNMPGKELSDTWLEKYMTIYSMMESRHYRDPRFASIRAAYESKMRALNMMPKNK